MMGRSEINEAEASFADAMPMEKEGMVRQQRKICSSSRRS